MEKEILSEIVQLKTAISILIGTAELTEEDRFSKKGLDKVEKDFKKLSIERGDWIEEYYIKKFLKNAPYKAGAFIRQELGFKNYFKRGQTYYYNKKDLIALGKEL